MNKKTGSLLALFCTAALLAGCGGDAQENAADTQLKPQSAQQSATAPSSQSTSANSNTSTNASTASTQPAQSTASAPGSPIDQESQPVAASQTDAKPTLKMSVDVNGQSAVVHFQTTNFKLSPEHYSQANVPGEGHIHLFVDGSPMRVSVKEATYTLTGLKPGKHTLEASLHTNNHQPYNVQDKVDFDVQ